VRYIGSLLTHSQEDSLQQTFTRRILVHQYGQHTSSATARAIRRGRCVPGMFMVVIGLRQGVCDWQVLFADRDAQLGQLMTWQITIVTGLELCDSAAKLRARPRLDDESRPLRVLCLGRGSRRPVQGCPFARLVSETCKFIQVRRLRLTTSCKVDSLSITS